LRILQWMTGVAGLLSFAVVLLYPPHYSVGGLFGSGFSYSPAYGEVYYESYSSAWLHLAILAFVALSTTQAVVVSGPGANRRQRGVALLALAALFAHAVVWVPSSIGMMLWGPEDARMVSEADVILGMSIACIIYLRGAGD
jgi:hypothetical protein